MGYPDVSLNKGAGWTAWPDDDGERVRGPLTLSGPLIEARQSWGPAEAPQGEYAQRAPTFAALREIYPQGRLVQSVELLMVLGWAGRHAEEGGDDYIVPLLPGVPEEETPVGRLELTTVSLRGLKNALVHDWLWALGGVFDVRHWSRPITDEERQSGEKRPLDLVWTSLTYLELGGRQEPEVAGSDDLQIRNRSRLRDLHRAACAGIPGRGVKPYTLPVAVPAHRTEVDVEKAPYAEALRELIRGQYRPATLWAAAWPDPPASSARAPRGSVAL